MIEKYFFYLWAVVAFGFGVFFIFQNREWAMAGLFPVMLIFLFFANLDKISEIEWLGGKAKTREVVNEARATIDQIRKLAVVFAENIITGVVTSGRWGGSGAETHERVRKDIIAILRELGVDEIGIKNAQATFVKYIAFDHVHHILDHAPPTPEKSEFIDRWNDLMQRSSFGSEMPPPDEIERFFIDCGNLDEKTKESINDYRYFLEHHEFRNLERFNKFL